MADKTTPTPKVHPDLACPVCGREVFVMDTYKFCSAEDPAHPGGLVIRADGTYRLPSLDGRSTIPATGSYETPKEGR